MSQSQDELDTLEVLDDGEFLEEGQLTTGDEPDKIIVSKKARRGTRRLIDDVLDEQRLRKVLKGYEDCYQTNDVVTDNAILD